MPSECPQEAATRLALANGPETGDGRPDHASEICSEWLAQHAEHETLTRRWQELESHLIREHDWFRLSELERNVLPQAAELEAMEDRLRSLFESKMQLLSELLRNAATTAESITLKLMVATASVLPDENLEAHNLLRSILDDMQATFATRA
jgi:hypothetical protein